MCWRCRKRKDEQAIAEIDEEEAFWAELDQGSHPAPSALDPKQQPVD